MRRRPHRIDQGLPTPIARQPAKVVSTDDHDLFAAVDRHVLRPFLFRASYDLAELGFGLLQLPVPRSRAA